jgi:monoamine oxidase
VPDTDVVIVGAGFAGLAAADALRRAGVQTVVLEAQERVGGRARSELTTDGVPLELGAQWVGPEQRRMLALAERLGVEVFPTYLDGRHLTSIGGRLTTGKRSFPHVGLTGSLSLALALRRFDRLAKRVRPQAPWLMDGADALDSQTLSTWLDRAVPIRAGRRVAEMLVQAVTAAGSPEMSALHALCLAGSAGGLRELLDAEESRLRGGAQGLAQRLAETMPGGVRLGIPVRRIEQDGERVVAGGDGVRVEARRAVVAVPPALAARIEYIPPLPGQRDQLTQRVPMGTAIKCLAVYPRPFWRGEGLSGIVFSDGGLLHGTFDVSPLEGRPGILGAFIFGRRALEYAQRPADVGRTAVLAELTQYFGPDAASPSHYIAKSWADDAYARGCYSGQMVPGTWTGLGEALRRPVQRIHWAGTETALEWRDYMEGALESGERVADEVLEAL